MTSNPSDGASAFVRTATLQDTEIIAEYNMRMASETESVQLDKATVLEGVKTAVSNPSYGLYYLVEIDHQVVGQLRAEYQWLPFHGRFEHWIQSVYIHPEHRRRGYYRMLYNHTRTEALKQGAQGIKLYADFHNQRAKNTYRNLGMTESYKVYGMGHLP